MFYCQACATKNEWPDWTLSRSYGACEVCKKTADCFDVPSRLLPMPKAKREEEK